MKKTPILSKIYLLLVMLFMYAPIFVLIVFSFNTTKSHSRMSGFTFDWYIKLFHNELILRSLLNTIIVAATATICATILGTAAAVGINSMKKITRTAVLDITNLPVISPEIVTGVSLMILFSFFVARMNLDFGFKTLIMAHITFDVPYVILNIMPRFSQMNPNIYEAAQDLGCSPAKAFFKVVLPEIMPGIISGMMMAFALSLDDFVVSYFTNGSSAQTLPITIYSMTRRKVSPEINALSTIIFLVVIIVLITKNIIARKQAANRRAGR